MSHVNRCSMRRSRGFGRGCEFQIQFPPGARTRGTDAAGTGAIIRPACYAYRRWQRIRVPVTSASAAVSGTARAIRSARRIRMPARATIASRAVL